MFGVDTIIGLPVHALVVHFAVVLVPLAALAFIAVGLRAETRRKYAFPVALVAVAGAGAAFVAAQSGGPLRRAIRAAAASTGTRADFGGHPGNGNLAEILAVLFALSAVAMWIAERRTEKAVLKGPTLSLIYVSGSVLAIGALVAMVVAGHSGALLVWKDLGNYVRAP